MDQLLEKAVLLGRIYGDRRRRDSIGLIHAEDNVEPLVLEMMAKELGPFIPKGTDVEIIARCEVPGQRQTPRVSIRPAGKFFLEERELDGGMEVLRLITVAGRTGESIQLLERARDALDAIGGDAVAGADRVRAVLASIAQGVAERSKGPSTITFFVYKGEKYRVLPPVVGGPYVVERERDGVRVGDFHHDVGPGWSTTGAIVSDVEAREMWDAWMAQAQPKASPGR